MRWRTLAGEVANKADGKAVVALIQVTQELEERYAHMHLHTRNTWTMKTACASTSACCAIVCARVGTGVEYSRIAL